MKYCDIRPAVEAYRNGQNVMATLRGLCGENANTEDIVEIAYDLQSGSYAKYVAGNADYWRAYCAEIGAVLGPFAAPGSRVLDVGTGEMTTLAGVAASAFPDKCDLFACDISFSRIKHGRAFVARNLRAGLRDRLESFVGNLFRLPFQDASIDVVWTSHALEPNGGRELDALSELFRIARGHVVLCEPSYENNSAEGRARMEALGYVRDLPGWIEKAGGELLDVIAFKNVANPLNPTHAYVCGVPGAVGRPSPESPWGCPATRQGLVKKSDCFFSPASKLAYPIIGGIPILREEAAVLASALDEEPESVTL